MFSPKSINKNYTLIRINKEVQAQKREKIGRIYIPPTLIHMTRNLQAGEVLMVGSYIQEAMPMLNAGDKLLFHHSVEGTILSDSEKERERQDKRQFEISHLIHEDETYNYYMVRQDLTYGCMKEDGTIFCHPNIIFAIAAPDEENNRDLKRSGHLYVFKNYKEERADIQRRIDEMKRECETHKERAPIIMPEMETLTRSLNKKRAAPFMPVFVPDKLHKMFGRKIDTKYAIWYEFLGANSVVPQVTQIEVEGIWFYILRIDYVLMAKKLKQFKDEEDTVTLHELTTQWDREQEAKAMLLPEAARSKNHNIVIHNKKKLW